jgi:predicted esterase
MQRGDMTTRSTLAVGLLGVCFGTGCAPRSSGDPELTSHVPFVELAVPGHNQAIVSLPLGTSSPRPLLVATHGAGDRAEWHCELWRGIVGDRAFVLCPQGRRTDERVPHASAGYYYPDHFALDAEVRAAVAALRQRYREHLDVTQAVYAGFSQGAIHGSQVIVLHPDLFPRAALVEGGNGFFNEWSVQAARRYQAGGGKRVLFGCGSPACVRTAERCAGYLKKAGAEALVVHAEGAGHSYGLAMEAELRENFEWLVADDPRWTLE